MLYALFGWMHAAASRRARAIVAALEGERGQGTVEYVGLILLVALLMVGMVAAMKGFNKSFHKGRDPPEGVENPSRARLQRRSHTRF